MRAMDNTLREHVKRHLDQDSRAEPYVDVYDLAGRIMVELGYDGIARRVMLTRLIMNQCALSGVAMRLGADAMEHRSVA